jgi:small subunit ribosomal protein S18
MSEYARKPKRRYCAFCKDKVEYIDYKDVST